LYVYEAYQPYSLTFISSFHLPPSCKYPHIPYFTVLSFIINSKAVLGFEFRALYLLGKQVWNVSPLPF
jgi:hypothetical protein